MALLQIAEPGQSTAPHEHRLAVGIDLGTTNSLVATVRNGVATVLPDEQGRPLLPSIVRYAADGKVEVGYAAQARQSDDARNTIISVKRFMGRGLKDVGHVENAPYDFVDAPGMLQLRTAAGVKSPVEVSAEILKVLRRRAELALGGSPRYWVYFVAGPLFFSLPALLESAGREAPSSNWGALRRFLPVPAPLPSGGDTAWRELAAAVAWNYSHFLVGTRA